VSGTPKSGRKMLGSKKYLQADGKEFPDFFLGFLCGGTLLKNTHPKGLFKFWIGLNPAFLDFSGSLRYISMEHLDHLKMYIAYIPYIN